MEKKVETTIVYWGYIGNIGVILGYIGIMENKREAGIIVWGIFKNEGCLVSTRNPLVLPPTKIHADT